MRQTHKNGYTTKYAIANVQKSSGLLTAAELDTGRGLF
jgi:hypothetical protein|nr:MAG TPA: hypothetical protein [Caudoviricetes sp.]